MLAVGTALLNPEKGQVSWDRKKRAPSSHPDNSAPSVAIEMLPAKGCPHLHGSHYPSRKTSFSSPQGVRHGSLTLGESLKPLTKSKSSSSEKRRPSSSSGITPSKSFSLDSSQGSPERQEPRAVTVKRNSSNRSTSSEGGGRRRSRKRSSQAAPFRGSSQPKEVLSGKMEDQSAESRPDTLEPNKKEGIAVSAASSLLRLVLPSSWDRRGSRQSGLRISPSRESSQQESTSVLKPLSWLQWSPFKHSEDGPSNNKGNQEVSGSQAKPDPPPQQFMPKVPYPNRSPPPIPVDAADQMSLASFCSSIEGHTYEQINFSPHSPIPEARGENLYDECTRKPIPSIALTEPLYADDPLILDTSGDPEVPSSNLTPPVNDESSPSTSSPVTPSTSPFFSDWAPENTQRRGSTTATYQEEICIPGSVREVRRISSQKKRKKSKSTGTVTDDYQHPIGTEPAGPSRNSPPAMDSELSSLAERSLSIDTRESCYNDLNFCKCSPVPISYIESPTEGDTSLYFSEVVLNIDGSGMSSRSGSPFKEPTNPCVSQECSSSDNDEDSLEFCNSDDEPNNTSIFDILDQMTPGDETPILPTHLRGASIPEPPGLASSLCPSRHRRWNSRKKGALSGRM